MNRAKRRREEREAIKKKTKVYNLTKEQLDNAVRAGIEKELQRARQEATDETLDTAMFLMLTIPLEVLKKQYWKKSYSKRIPKFIEYVLEYYELWEKGELDVEEFKKDLWKYAGVKLEESDIK